VSFRNLKRRAQERLLSRPEARRSAVTTEAATAALDEHEDAFYVPPASCQIPTLGFLYRLFFGRRADGTFVEIGAYDGHSFSNSSCLAEVGWRGLYVEAVPEFADLCQKRYAGNERIAVVNAAVSETVGDLTIFVGGPFSTADMETLGEMRRLEWSRSSFAENRSVVVPRMPLDSLLAENWIRPRFEVLIVDVEGHEPEVFDGFDLARWHPQMIIAELVDTHPDLASTRGRHAHLSRTIVGHGYVIVYKDMINTMFVSRGLFDAAYGEGLRTE